MGKLPRWALYVGGSGLIVFVLCCCGLYLYGSSLEDEEQAAQPTTMPGAPPTADPNEPPATSTTVPTVPLVPTEAEEPESPPTEPESPPTEPESPPTEPESPPVENPTEAPVPTVPPPPTEPPAPTATTPPTEPPAERQPTGGLGLSREVWEQQYGQPESTTGSMMALYGDISVIYWSGTVQGLTVVFDQARTLDQMRDQVREYLPDDAQRIDTYYAEINEADVDVYQSEWLASRLSEDAWFGEPPGTFIVINHLTDAESWVVIGTGNNP